MSVNLENPVLYPVPYFWYVMLGTLDIVLTWVVLMDGGSEVNPVADWFLRNWGLSGLIWLKFGVLVMVVMICEFVGKHKPDTGRRVAHWAVALNCIPVSVTLLSLILVMMRGGGGDAAG